MNPLMLPIQRPVAIAMFFLGVVLLGVIAWYRLPVELFPNLEGDQLRVQFHRPGSDPEVVEREILLPMQARVSALSDINETFAEIRGPGGYYMIKLEPGAELKVRELELQRIISDIQKEQPLGTQMFLQPSGTGSFSSFAMMVNVTGDTEDKDALFDVVEQLVAPRFASVPGVSQATVTGGAGRQVIVTVDPARATALGVTTDAVSQAVRKNVGRLRYVGKLEDESGRVGVVLDGRPGGLHALGDIRIQPDRPVLLRHVAEVEFGVGLRERLFRVNGQPAVGLAIFQEQGTNLVRLGRLLRERVAEVRLELQNQGLDLVIGTDAAESIEEQIDRLSTLGATGFGIALIVLFFFLRQWRAVAVVAIAVPISLMAALGLLYLSGQSLNLVTLFGLALAIGLVVDNSVVVFEAVQRHLERGTPVEAAVELGLKRTVRAILAASATTAVVFLPLVLVEFEQQMIRELSQVLALSILLPLAGSVLVAVGLVPLLAHRLSAPAARRRLAAMKERRRERGGLLPPDQARMLFTAIVRGALRHPPGWITGTIVAMFLTLVIALPWVLVNSEGAEAENADSVQLAIQFPNRGSVARASVSMAKLEQAVLDLPGVENVEVMIEEEQGQITVQLVDLEIRPPGFRAQKVRDVIRGEARKIEGLEVLRPGEEERGNKVAGGGEGGGGFGGGPPEIVLSGPDSAQLERLASLVQAQLESMAFVESAWMSVRPGMEEFWVQPDHRVFESMGLTFDSVLPMLRLAGREGQRMQTGFVLGNGRELPVVVARKDARLENVGRRDLTRVRVPTAVGVVPIATLATMTRMPAPQVIAHHNGRREIAVRYRLSSDIPETGPTRLAIEDEIAATMRSIPRPGGTALETPDKAENTDLLRQILVPAILLLFLVLAMTFESLSLPVLVLLSLPLTLLGATWALALAGMSLGQMAILGALTLVGLTVNPAILLTDRMQQLVREANFSTGAAALMAVRERTRPVLMTTATTVAGLWPLSIATGRENEIWPPFATIVIGGLITSALLTLLMMPVGFILLRRIDDLFARVGPWLVLAWLGGCAAVMSALIFTDVLISIVWQFAVGLLVAGFSLAIIVMLFRPREIDEPDCSDGPPRLEVRHLHKTYGAPGPLRAAMLAPGHFARKVLERGVSPFHRGDATDRLIPLALGVIGVIYVSLQVSSIFWTLLFAIVTGLLLGRFAIEVKRARGFFDETGAVLSGGPENWVANAAPWLALALATYLVVVAPVITGWVPAPALILPALVALVMAVLIAMRANARKQASGVIPGRMASGSWRAVRNLWRAASARIAGFDLPVVPIEALARVSFTVERGMVGILGPNGAGKTTLLRQLAGVLDPSRGVIRYGGVPMRKIQRHLARWVGYLPQDSGLPGNMSPREYLTWYAALYDVEPAIREDRVDDLLDEVGLEEKSDDRIKALSGGMRQRVAVARTLLRLPPVIIVDEPTIGLDPRERIRFRNLLSRLARDRIVLMSTHVVEDVAVACERVLVIARGGLIYDGATDALAEFASGSVWELRRPATDVLELPAGAVHVEEKPAADGTIVHRILAANAPAADAAAVDASLEDGYMWLLEQEKTGSRVSTAT